jgi:hypothetical protein
MLPLIAPAEFLTPASEVAGGHTLPFLKGHGLPILKWYGISSCTIVGLYMRNSLGMEYICIYF